MEHCRGCREGAAARSVGRAGLMRLLRGGAAALASRPSGEARAHQAHHENDQSPWLQDDARQGRGHHPVDVRCRGRGAVAAGEQQVPGPDQGERERVDVGVRRDAA